jgi:hypothetical protein
VAPADLVTQLDRRPFVPFRIVTSDSTVYEVRHPELVVVSLASAVIGYPQQDQHRVASRYDIVSIRHIIRLEPMHQSEAEIPSDGNGQNTAWQPSSPLM